MARNVLTMYYRFGVVTALTIGTALFAALCPARAQLTIGVFNSTRAGDNSLLNGSDTSDLRSLIAKSLPSSTLVGTTTLTSSFLSGINVLLIGVAGNGGQNAAPISPLTTAEQAALTTFVMNGGYALIATDNLGDGNDNISTNNSLVNPFGLTTNVGSFGLTTINVLNPASTPITNGSFGQVTSYTVKYPGGYGSLGNAVDLGNVSGTSTPGLAYLAPGAFSSGSGAVVFSSEFIYDNGINRNSGTNAIILNTLASAQSSASAPEPGTLPLLLLAFVTGTSLAKRSHLKCRTLS